MDEIKIVTRATLPDDKNFIMKVWLEGNRYGNPYYKKQEKEPYFRDYSAYIISILLHAETSVNVACDSANPSWIAGFAVYKPNTLYWIHVRDGYRMRGIAHLLIKDQDIKVVKGLTKAGWQIIEKKGLVYDPR